MFFCMSIKMFDLCEEKHMPIFVYEDKEIKSKSIVDVKLEAI